MLHGPSQILILHLLNQGKIFLAISRERISKLLRSLRFKVRVSLVRIEGDKILSRQKSVEAGGKERAFRDQQMLQASERRPLPLGWRAAQQTNGKRTDHLLPALRGGREYSLYIF